MKKLKKLGIVFASGACIVSLAAGIAACGGKSETPTVEQGTSSTLVTDKSPDQLSPENVIYAFMQKQSELQSYKITTEGTAVASLAGYEQDIHNVTYKSGDDYLNQASSDSVLVKMKHQAFSKGGKVVYRNSFDGEMKVAEKEDYVKVYGFTADDVLLGGYIINPKTLRFAQLEKTEGELLTYYMRLAGDQSVAGGVATESATSGIRLQAKAYGSLDNLPAFSDVDLRLTIKKDWTPVSYTSSCSYEAKKIFNMSVEQNVVCTYSDVNGIVAIPDAKEFNAKIGTTPSEVTPDEGETDPLMQLVEAAGSAFDAESTLSVPASVAVTIGEQHLDLPGQLTLKLNQDALNGGDLAAAFNIRYDLDLGAVPLVSGIASTLTLRYLGDGLLFVMLNNPANGKDNYIFTYAADLNGMTLGGADFSLENLQTTVERILNIETSEAGFELTIKPSVLLALNAAYTQAIASLTEQVGDTYGIIESLLGFTFTDLKVEIEGLETMTGITVSVAAEPGENITTGEKFGVTIDTQLGGGMLSNPFTGDIKLHLDPAAVWSGNYYAIAKAHLHLDLSPAKTILGMVGSFAPAGSLPPFVNGDLDNMDLYYMGDGMLTLIFNNKDGQATGVMEFDLRETTSSEQASPMALEEEPEAPQTSLGILPITITINENNLVISLNGPIVQQLDAMYNELVDSLIASAVEGAGGGFAGSAAQGLLTSMLKAQITELVLTLGTSEEAKPYLDFAVMGILSGKTDVVRLLGLNLSYIDRLTEEERTILDAGEKPAAARELYAQALVYINKLQQLIDHVDLTDAGMAKYESDVRALVDEIAALPEEVQMVVSNKSALDETEFSDKNKYPGLITTQKAWRTRVEDFRNKMAANDDYTQFTAEQWAALDNIYDNEGTITWGGILGIGEKSITIPAVKDCPSMIEAIGEAHIAAYTLAREEYDAKVAQAFLEEFNPIVEAFAAKDKTSKDDMQAELTKLTKEVLPKYNALASKGLVSSTFDPYALAVCKANLQMITAEYTALNAKFEQLFAGTPTLEALIPLLKEYSDLYTWHGGWNYWPTSAVKADWGDGWLNAVLATLQEDAKAELQAADKEATAARAGFAVDGTISTQIRETLGDAITAKLTELKEQLTPCRSKNPLNIYTYDFTKLGIDDVPALENLLQTMQGLRYMFDKMFSANAKKEFLVDGSELYTFTTSDLKTFEKELVKHINSKK